MNRDQCSWQLAHIIKDYVFEEAETKQEMAAEVMWGCFAVSQDSLPQKFFDIIFVFCAVLLLLPALFCVLLGLTLHLIL